MRILLLTPQLPFPPHQGTTIRNYNIIRNLAARHRITLVSFGTADELSNAPELCRLCERIEIVPYPTRTTAKRLVAMVTSTLPDMGLRLESPAMHRAVASVLKENGFDVVQIEAIEMAGYVFARDQPTLRTPVVFDDHNAEYVLQESAFRADSRRPTRWHTAGYSFVQWTKLKRYERDICSRAQHIIAASDADADAIHRLNSGTPITIVPNGVDTQHFVPSGEVCAKPLAELGMIYAGKMDFRPNVDAMEWFCDDILPRVRAEIPLAHVTVVGQRPTPAVQSLSHKPGVQVTGWVPDTRPFIADAAVYVVPLRMGSGTRLKVLEAMAMGKAIVSTSRGVQGIDLVPGRDMLISDSAPDFAKSIVSLFRDPEKRARLGKSARKQVEDKYDWTTIIPELDRIYASVVRSPRNL